MCPFVAWTCVPICPNATLPRTYTDYTSRECVPICNWSTYYYSDNTTGDCLSVCPGGLFADNYSQTCVQRCYGENELYNFGFKGDKTCTSLCNAEFFAQNSTRLCVSFCPLS